MKAQFELKSLLFVLIAYGCVVLLSDFTREINLFWFLYAVPVFVAARKVIVVTRGPCASGVALASVSGCHHDRAVASSFPQCRHALSHPSYARLASP